MKMYKVDESGQRYVQTNDNMGHISRDMIDNPIQEIQDKETKPKVESYHIPIIAGVLAFMFIMLMSTRDQTIYNINDIYIGNQDNEKQIEERVTILKEELQSYIDKQDIQTPSLPGIEADRQTKEE